MLLFRHTPIQILHGIIETIKLLIVKTNSDYLKTTAFIVFANLAAFAFYSSAVGSKDHIRKS